MNIQNVGVVSSLLTNYKKTSVDSTQNNKSQSFGYSLANCPYESAAFKFLAERDPELYNAFGIEILNACRKYSNVQKSGKIPADLNDLTGKITDALMDKVVSVAEKLGFVSNAKRRNPPPPEFPTFKKVA